MTKKTIALILVSILLMLSVTPLFAAPVGSADLANSVEAALTSRGTEIAALARVKNVLIGIFRASQILVAVIIAIMFVLGLIPIVRARDTDMKDQVVHLLSKVSFAVLLLVVVVELIVWIIKLN